MAAWAAGIALVAAIGGAAGLRTRQVAQSTAAMAEHVVDEHVRALTSQRLFDVRSSNQHTVKPWFQGKLDFAPVVNDLAPSGYPLTGGRLDYIDGRPVAALTYRSRLHVLNLFEWPAADAGDAKPELVTRNGYSMVRWKRGGLQYWLVSDASGADLLKFAHVFGS